jgi:hypothetical protein
MMELRESPQLERMQAQVLESEQAQVQVQVQVLESEQVQAQERVQEKEQELELEPVQEPEQEQEQEQEQALEPVQELESEQALVPGSEPAPGQVSEPTPEWLRLRSHTCGRARAAQAIRSRVGLLELQQEVLLEPRRELARPVRLLELQVRAFFF